MGCGAMENPGQLALRSQSTFKDGHYDLTEDVRPFKTWSSLADYSQAPHVAIWVRSDGGSSDMWRARRASAEIDGRLLYGNVNVTKSR